MNAGAVDALEYARASAEIERRHRRDLIELARSGIDLAGLPVDAAVGHIFPDLEMP